MGEIINFGGKKFNFKPKQEQKTEKQRFMFLLFCCLVQDVSKINLKDM